MKKEFRTYFFLALLLLFFCHAYPCHAGREIDGFRVAKWENSFEENKSSLLNSGAKIIYEKKLDNGELCLRTLESLFNTPIDVSYYFDNKDRKLFFISITVVPQGDLKSGKRDLVEEQRRINIFTEDFEGMLTENHGFPVEESSHRKESLSSRGFEVISSKIWIRDWEKNSGIINFTKNKLSYSLLGEDITIPEIRFISPGRYYPNKDTVDNYRFKMNLSPIISNTSMKKNSSEYEKYINSFEGQMKVEAEREREEALKKAEEEKKREEERKQKKQQQMEDNPLGK